jgi:OOP family OmpA-OmpF porin
LETESGEEKIIKKRPRIATFACMMVALIVFASFSTVEAKVIPRITNFIFLVDQSNSMFEVHSLREVSKARLAKEILIKANEKIPLLDYSGAIQVFLPERRLIGPTEYNRGFFKNAFGKLRERGRDEPSATPLGPAMMHLAKIIPDFEGKTAVIIISDGMANLGLEPIKAALQLYETHPNICFHVISLATKDKGEKNLRDIAAVNGCAFFDGGDILTDEAAMDRFIAEVFYTEIPQELSREDMVTLATSAAEETAAVQPEMPSFEAIFFNFDKSDIKPEEKEFLDENLEVLKKDPNLKIVIEGHTDYVGSEAYNQMLSERRARTVYDYLFTAGIASDRMKTIGYGENMPAISNLTPEGRAINRRVEIVSEK